MALVWVTNYDDVHLNEIDTGPLAQFRYRTNFEQMYTAQGFDIEAPGMKAEIDTLVRGSELAAQDWIKKYTKGSPKATDVYTVEELEAMGVYGLYEEVAEE